ncbi:MAG: DUF1829 domain-containing protein [Chloroflexota bacterium]|jgi:hypothetical protein
MTTTNIDNLISEYYTWLRAKTSVQPVDAQWSVITTPYLDRHNDYLQMYVRALPSGGYELSDDGYTITDLADSGCDMSTPRRQQLLRTTLNGFGVTRDGDALVVRGEFDQFATKKHNLVQAMLSINDMFYTTTSHQSSIFVEDVSAWFDTQEVRYTSNVKLTGTSGLDHRFDFVIPKSRHAPERLIQVINRPNSDTTQLTLFQFTDIRHHRQPDGQCIVLINDEQPVRASFLQGFRNYDIVPVLWSRRVAERDTFVA